MEYPPWVEAPRRGGGRNFVVAIQPAHFFGNVCREVQVRPPGGDGNGAALHGDFQTAQVFHHVRLRNLGAQKLVNPVRLQLQLLGLGTWFMISMVPSSTSPQASCSTSSQARWTAGMVSMGSRFFSNLPEASVRSPRAKAVWRMEVPSKLADSKTTVVVSATISEFSPPIIPARPMGLSPVGNHQHTWLQGRRLPSRVVMVSP